MRESRTSKIMLTVSMVIFGTIGIFRKYIPLPSSMIAMLRGLVGMLFMLGVGLLSGRKLSLKAIRKSIPMLCLSGTLMGFNWILLFEAYRYTSVAVATLCYYMAPIFVILASPVLLRERLTRKKAVCVLVALVGMVFVSGVLDSGVGSLAEMRGVLLGLGAAVLYASVILINKRLTDVPSQDRTIMQLGAAGIVLIPYTLLTENLAAVSVTPVGIIMLAIVCVVHTGVAYALYFGSMKDLKAQTVALLSYIDPVVAIILSALLLGESMSVWVIVGAALVLGGTLVSELPDKK